MFSDGLGLGCTTIIELPLYMYPIATRSPSLLPLKNGEETDTTLMNSECDKIGHNCLVVDDSLPNRKLLARLLEKAGHSCVLACDGLEAIRMIIANRETTNNDPAHALIDTILMDYEMPVMNGPKATKALREQGCSAIIIGITGNVLAEDISYFMEMGANKVLAKPVNLLAIEQCWDRFGQ